MKTRSLEAIVKIAKQEGEVFARTLADTPEDAPIYYEMCRLFTREMRRATNGRICTPERMAALYSIFREINLELDDIAAEERYYARLFVKEQGKKPKRSR